MLCLLLKPPMNDSHFLFQAEREQLDGGANSVRSSGCTLKKDQSANDDVQSVHPCPPHSDSSTESDTEPPTKVQRLSSSSEQPSDVNLPQQSDTTKSCNILRIINRNSNQ